MFIESVDLENYRNYGSLHLDLGEGIHIFHGENAQGKTNLIEALYLACTNKSYRGAKDKELIQFGHEEGHIRIFTQKNENSYRIDMHLKAGRAKGIAVNGVPVKRARDFLGVMNAVIFSPEDLLLVKEGPQERRKFIDTELCFLDKIYLNSYVQYKKALEQRNQLLKDAAGDASLLGVLDVWDESLVKYGVPLIKARKKFTEDIKEFIKEVHEKLTGGKETLEVLYEGNVSADDFAKELRKQRNRDLKAKTTTVGPHRDDLSFKITAADKEPIDARVFGSQGQQRTCALSLKMAEIQYVTEITKESPVLFLDDVLSELDGNRQRFLLESIKDIQTFITCTGLDDFISHRFKINKTYRVSNGVVLNDE